MTIECAAILPVMAIVVLFCVSALVYINDCCVCDMACADCVRMNYDQALDADANDQVRNSIRERASSHIKPEDITVTKHVLHTGHVRFDVILRYMPPVLKGVRVFGYTCPQLTHKCSFVISPYRSHLYDQSAPLLGHE